MKAVLVYWIFFGTNTDPGKSEGIYRAEFNAETGQISKMELAAKVGHPSFLHIAPDGKHLYAVGEAPGKDGGGVYSWKLDAKTGTLSDKVSLTSKGDGPCHISTDAKNEFAVVANYGGGSTSSFKLKADGSLDSRTGFIQHTGSSVNPNRQKEPHAHSAFFDKSGTLVFVPDLGIDKVLIHKLDRKTGEIAPGDPAFIKLPDGSGPRHIHISPDNSVAFVCGELDMTVNVVKMDAKNNKFEVVQSLTTLPEGVKHSDKFSTAEVRIHPNGKFVYVSNRGQDTIAAFAWDAEKFQLKAIGHIKGDIKTPRNFNISPDGKWMIVCNQSGGNAVVFAIDTKTGLAEETKFKIPVEKSVCVKFLAKQ